MPQNQLTIKLTVEPGEIMVSLDGWLGADQAQQAEQVLLEELLERLDDSQVARTVVDFAQLAYISSVGLGMFLALQKRLDERGQRLKLVNLQPKIRGIFELCRFHEVLDIEPPCEGPSSGTSTS